MKTFVTLLMCMLTMQCTAASNWVFVNETPPGFSAEPGDYNATAVTVKLGPHNLSFSTRIEYPIFRGYYEKSGYNKPAGKGKDYHMCTYDIGMLEFSSSEYEPVNDARRVYGAVTFEIYRYVAPLDYPPTWPGAFYDFTRFGAHREPLAWEDFEPENAFLPVDVVVNGRIGTILCRDYEKRENYVDDKEHVECIYAYSPDPTTFMVVHLYDMDWSKDISLVIETLNVTS
jgi:hypothetical protein